MGKYITDLVSANRVRLIVCE